MKDNVYFLDRCYLEIIEYDKHNLHEDIDKFIAEMSDNKTFSNFYEWLLVVTYIFYKKRGFLKDKDNLYSSEVKVIGIYTNKNRKNSFYITEGMLYFLSEFIYSRLFNVPISLRSTITELKEELNSLTEEREINSLNTQLNVFDMKLHQKIKKAQGLNSILAFSKGKIKLFTSIVIKNMNQFSLNLPTDNLTLDSEYKKAKNLIKNLGENPEVKIANNKALNFYNVEFEYFPPNEFDEAYFKMKVKNKKNLSTNGSYEQALENAFKVELKPFDPNTEAEKWRPTNSYILVAILKQISLGFGGQCSMSDLKKIFATLFNQVKKENSDYFETQMLENYEASDLKNINYNIDLNSYTEDAFKERRYYNTKIKKFISEYFDNLNPDTKKYELKVNEIENYINLLKEIVNNLKNNEKLELSDINETTFIDKGVNFTLHSDFLKFLKDLREPKSINFSPLIVITKIATLNENYKLRIEI